MSKKITAFGFVLLATLSVLAHAVIPHHHHQVVVCVEDIQHEEHACHHDDGVHEHGNDHQEGQSHATPCEFKLAVVVPSSQGKQLKSCDDCLDSHQHISYLPTVVERVELPLQLAAVTNNPVYASFYTSFVTPTLGLRAPPFV